MFRPAIKGVDLIDVVGDNKNLIIGGTCSTWQKR